MIQWDKRQLTLSKLQEYANTVHDRGGPSQVWGFVNGTLRGIARPGKNQKQYYSGHKKKRGLKWQGIVTPDKLILGLHGPAPGKTGDWKMWMDSKISEQLRALVSHLEAIEQPVLYKDNAYVQGRFGLVGAFSATSSQALSQEQQEFNRTITLFQIAVEHTFGKVSNL